MVLFLICIHAIGRQKRNSPPPPRVFDMDRAAKAERQITDICKQLGITHEGRVWIDTALDPFKDIPTKPLGYPDNVMTSSVVQTVHDSFDVSGDSLGFVGNWDCNIFLDNVVKSIELIRSPSSRFQTTFNASAQAPYIGTPHRRGGVSVRAANAGTVLDITTTQNSVCQSLVTDVFDNETSARLIGIGLEIHNTTSDLHKQGSIICYRVNDQPDETVATMLESLTSTTSQGTSAKALELVEPPYSAGEAIDLPGSVQWDAAKGCYIVPQMHNDENPPRDMKQLLIYCFDVNASTASFFPAIINGTGNPNNIWGVDAPDSQNVLSPFSMSGAYLTGLSKETTLTVNLTYYYEQFPSFSSPLRRLTSASAAFDPPALELYGKVCRHMPTGVEVNDNFLGAFISGISTVMRTVAKFAPTVARVAGGVQSAATMVQAISDSVKTQNKLTNGPSLGDLQLSKNKTEVSREVDIISKPNGSVEKKVKVTAKAPVPYIQERAPRNRRNNNRRARSQTVHSNRDPSYNRLMRYYDAGNAGNKYLM